MKRNALLILVCSTSLVLAAACGGGEDKCAQIKRDISDCLNLYCSGTTAAAGAVCRCWAKGQDIRQDTCQCMPLNLDATCASVDVERYAGLDCNAAQRGLATICTRAKPGAGAGATGAAELAFPRCIALE